MLRGKTLVVAVGLASAPLIGIVGWQAVQGISGLSRSPPGVDEGRTVGDRRLAMLKELTAEYIAGEPEAALAVTSGKQLAPVPYLNRRLEKNGASWRVRSVDGLRADTYLVS